MKTTLLMRCGCEIAFHETPCCPTHGSTIVARVLNVAAPTIRGTATGPHVRTQPLAPATAPIVEKVH